MKNTERYYQAVLVFRQAVEGVNEKFRPQYERLEQFKDSKHYQEEKETLDKARSELLAEVRELAMKELNEACDAMKAAYGSRPLSAPSDEQLRLLQTLQMREKLGVDELRQASVALEGCPAALEVLRELAHKHGHTWAMQGELAGDAVQRTIDQLRQSGEKFTRRLERTDSRREFVSAGDYDMFRLAGEPVDATETLRIFGLCTEPERFMEAVGE
ncbi:MAG: hypothetical protein HFF04_07505 [Oscillospiraceae bacterium]|nr:hypothetical protein [Oscillospiraceae bacterium]